jgi:glycosyltransferase 2 family protein
VYGSAPSGVIRVRLVIRQAPPCFERRRSDLSLGDARRDYHGQPLMQQETPRTVLVPELEPVEPVSGPRISKRSRIVIQAVLGAALIGYLVWRIDVRETVAEVANSNPIYVLAAAVIFTLTLVPMAWRWSVLLASKGIHEPFSWLVKLYYIGYSVSQVLPTGIGGDALRIVEHARRRPNRKGEVAGAVLMERAVGSGGTLIVVALGLVLAVGRYDNIQLFTRVAFISIAATVIFTVLIFSRRTHDFLQAHVFPRGAGFKLHRPMSSLWSALHGYRTKPRALGLALAVTVVVQFVRMIAIWLCGEAVGLDLSILVYVILGPLLFLVMMVPITINGLGVRETFFVVFLGRFGVAPDAAFATGFLFFAVTLFAAIPGGVILAARSTRGGAPSLRPVRRARA